MTAFSGAWTFDYGLPVFYFVIIILTAIVHLAFAAGVMSDAKLLAVRGGGTFLVSPGIWGFATLVGGVWVALAYWVIHHSNLRSRKPPWQNEGTESKE